MGYIRPVGTTGFVGTTGPVGTAGSPAVQKSPQVQSPYAQQTIPSITPYNQTQNTPAMVIFNFDGDSAQLSLPALNKSLLFPGSEQTQSMQPDAPSTERVAPLDPNTECETCANRKYVDGSDDSSVSFQTPTNISPNMAAAAVASHENEHVRNEQAKAARDDREIVQQSVTIHYDTCEECGRQYVSGGTTRTTSVSKGDSHGPAEFAGENQTTAGRNESQED